MLFSVLIALIFYNIQLKKQEGFSKKKSYLNSFETDFEIEIRLIASANKLPTLIIWNLFEDPIFLLFKIEFEITNFLIFDLLIFLTASPVKTP
jgi:hypothetical protein